MVLVTRIWKHETEATQLALMFNHQKLLKDNKITLSFAL